MRAKRTWRPTLDKTAHCTTQGRVARGGAQMVDRRKPTVVEWVPCAVCQKEFPKSVALSSEVQDYVLHFCGIDCYEEWSADDVVRAETF